jgi:hypothetical protein
MLRCHNNDNQWTQLYEASFCNARRFTMRNAKPQYEICIKSLGHTGPASPATMPSEYVKKAGHWHGMQS